MASELSYNSRCPAVKRLLREAQELHEATEEYFAQPLEDNLFEWHFTVRGPPDSDFDGGVYHGRIILPAEYPMKPPNVIFLTPNGRFETNKKICLNISGHHPETWQPSWSIRTGLLAIIGFMPTSGSGTIGGLDYTTEERAVLARKSVTFKCKECGLVNELLKERTSSNAELQEEAKRVMSEVEVTMKDNNDTPHQSSADLVALSNSTEGVTSAVEGGSREEKTVSRQVDELVPPSLVTSPDDSPAGGATDSSSASSTPVASHYNALNVEARSSSMANTSPGFLHNFLLSSAIILFLALLVRRLFLLGGSSVEELDKILI